MQARSGINIGNAGTLLLLALCAALATAPVPAAEAQAMRYIYNSPESDSDIRYAYHWKILKTALEKTQAEYGPFVLEPSLRMTERRQTEELENDTGRLSVMYLSTTLELERTLIPVRIPVDRNLGGYCILLIRKGESGRFGAVRSLEDLRPFSFGLGLGWIDVGILKANGFRVVTGSSYEGLFEMLANHRFDVFPRGAVEILDEFEGRRNSFPELEIEPSLIFYYPLPMYFWFPKTPTGQRLAARAETGMRKMIADGSYDRIFSEYQDDKIRRLDLKHRRVLALRNPNLGPETPFADTRLWFDPQTYRPHPRR